MRRELRAVSEVVTLLAASGAHANAACVAADEASDLALLRLTTPLPAGLGALPLGTSDEEGMAVLAAGQASRGGRVLTP